MVGKGKRVFYQMWGESSKAEQNCEARGLALTLTTYFTYYDFPSPRWAPRPSPPCPNIVAITRNTLGVALRPSPGTLSLGGRQCI